MKMFLFQFQSQPPHELGEHFLNIDYVEKLIP